LSENVRKIIENSKRRRSEASVESIIKKALKNIKSNLKTRIVCINFFLVLLFCGSVALAQVNEQSRIPQKLVIL
jgi:hypothetical protein